MNNQRGQAWSKQDIEALIASTVITIPLANGGYTFYNQYRVFNVGDLFECLGAVYEVIEVSEDQHSGKARYVPQ